jgi:ABC-2 type transport system ATP-binding protein
LINIRNLVKKYENLIAIDNLNLEIFDNEVFGLLGPNGAGKTTLIHVLATLLKPTSGTAIVNGYDIKKEPSKVRSSIGIVFQAPSSDDMLTGYENLKLHSLLYGVSPALREKRIDDVLNLVGLDDRRNDQVKKYSGGMRRRLEIARGLIHKPKVIFLDEPTLGLDPSSREIMWKYIERLVEEEKITIILTTHYMEEADFLCDRIGIIDRGKIIALDTPTRLKESLGGEIIKISLRKKQQLIPPNSNSNVNNPRNIEEILKKYTFVNKVELIDESLVIYVRDASHNLPAILNAIEDHNNNAIESVELKGATLNDVFLKFTGRHINIQEDHMEGGFMERYARYNK